MYALITFTVLSVFASFASADTCSASASIAVANSWTSTGMSDKQYTITIKNTGSCAITSISAFYGYSAADAIISAWNYNITSGRIINYGSFIPSGSSFNGAGFILQGTGSPSLAFLQPQCSSCNPSVSTSATLAPTSAPTPVPDQCHNQCTISERCVDLGGGPACHPISCADLTCAPNQFCLGDGGVARCENTSKRAVHDDCGGQCSSQQICVDLSNGPVCQPRSCSNLQCGSGEICLDDGGVARCIAVSTPTQDPSPNPCQSATSVAISVTPRAGSSSIVDGVPQQIYDISIKNVADISIDTITLTILAAAKDSIISEWNMAPLPESAYEYSVQTYGSLSGAGQSFSGAGFILRGPSAATTPTVGLALFTCSA